MNIKDWLGRDNTLGQDIWEKKYRYGSETFDGWLDRITKGNNELRKAIFEKKFIFAGRILANRGLDNEGRKITLSNCYVLNLEDDSIEAIYKTCAELARTYSYGGGCGIDISVLRPRGAKVNNSAKETTGAVSFMPTFDNVTATIGQNGRRGALMISIDVNHPDVMEFVDIKTDLNKVTSANISVRVSDAFMRAVENDDDYLLRWPCNTVVSDTYIKECLSNGVKYNEMFGEYDENTNTQYYFKIIKAKQLFNKLVANNWNYAEPGILYWDRISSYNLMSGNNNFRYAGVNPCAEEPLPDGGACNLGSINLSEFVDETGNFDYEELRRITNIAYKALNEVMLEGTKLHPLERQRESVGKYKQIGIGIMGLADAFIKMGIKYGDARSIAVTNLIGSTIFNEALRSSAEYVEEHADSFNAEYITLSSDDLKKSAMYGLLREDVKEYIEKVGGIFNTQVLTIAPTGTISTMFNISGGIEPIFALSYKRLTKSLNGTDTEYEVFPDIVSDYFVKNHTEVNLKELPDYYVSSADIPNEERIAMQSAWQRYIDASISSTINLPEAATVENVYGIYMNAWKSGLKGVTIFRSGCQRAAILTSSSEKKKCDCQKFVEANAPRRPKKLPCRILRFINKGEKWIAAVGLLEDRPYELFTGLAEKLDVPKGAENIYIVRNKIDGKSRYDIEYTLNGEVGTVEGLSTIFREEYWNYGKLISGLLRHSMPIPYVIKVISSLDFKDTTINSWKTGVVRALKEFSVPIETEDLCPECGAKLWNDGGCIICRNCGWSKCG